MPCSSSDGMGSAYATDTTAQRGVAELRQENIRLRQHLDIVTALVCAVYRQMDTEGKPVPPEAKDWWEAHKAHDQSEGRTP